MPENDKEIRQFKIERVANISASSGEDAVFWSISEVFRVDGEEKIHRNFNLSFPTEKEAEQWVKENSS